jgi:hypothetical protein
MSPLVHCYPPLGCALSSPIERLPSDIEQVLNETKPVLLC